MMTRKERFLTAAQAKQPDRVPMFDFLFQEPMYEALIGHRPGAYNTNDAVAMALALDHDALWVPFGGYYNFQPHYLAENVYVDEWGTTYQHNDSAWPIDAPIDYPIKGRADLKGWVSPDPTLPGRTDGIKAFLTLSHDNLALCPGVTGPFTTCWMLMGYEQICLSLYDDPALLTDLFRISNEYNMEAARLAVAAGADAIWVADDLGDSRNGFMKLAHFQKYYLSYLNEMVDYIAGLGVPVLLHCCGHFKPLLPDLAQTKISAIHPWQRTAGMDLGWAKENYGSRFGLIGNVDSSRTLPYGTPQEVIAEAKEAIEIAAPGGGYVLASDHSLHDGIPLENILALRQAGRDYGWTFYRD